MSRAISSAWLFLLSTSSPSLSSVTRRGITSGVKLQFLRFQYCAISTISFMSFLVYGDGLYFLPGHKYHVPNFQSGFILERGHRYRVEEESVGSALCSVGDFDCCYVFVCCHNCLFLVCVLLPRRLRHRYTLDFGGFPLYLCR